MKREDTMTSALKTTVHFSVYEPTIVLRIKAVVIVVHDLGENRHNYGSSLTSVGKNCMF